MYIFIKHLKQKFISCPFLHGAGRVIHVRDSSSCAMYTLYRFGVPEASTGGNVSLQNVCGHDTLGERLC